MSTFYEAVYRVVREIPRGQVMTYGQIATLLGSPRAARAVGYALRATRPEENVPWQRVINRTGGISARNEVERPLVQRVLLEAEGVQFRPDETCDLKVYQHHPDKPERFFLEIEGIPFI